MMDKVQRGRDSNCEGNKPNAELQTWQGYAFNIGQVSKQLEQNNGDKNCRGIGSYGHEKID